MVYKNVAELVKEVSANPDITEATIRFTDDIKFDSERNLAEIKLLAGFLQKNTSLKILDISDNNIRDDGATVIAKAIEANRSLDRVDISSNGIGTTGGIQIARSLTYSSLKDLNIRNNDIGDSGAIEFGEGLKSNKSIKQLQLGSNKIGNIGATGLFSGLIFNQSLVSLDFSYNLLECPSIAALCMLLETNITLKSLDLSNNYIRNNGAKDLGETLKDNTSLVYLNLSVNVIGRPGMKALYDGLKNNNSITTLSIHGNKNKASELVNSFSKCANLNTTEGKLRQAGTLAAIFAESQVIDESNNFRQSPSAKLPSELIWKIQSIIEQEKGKLTLKYAESTCKLTAEVSTNWAASLTPGEPENKIIKKPQSQRPANRILLKPYAGNFKNKFVFAHCENIGNENKPNNRMGNIK